MFSVVELNTSKVENLGVGFYTTERPNGDLICLAFGVRDSEKGFLGEQEIRDDIIHSGFIDTPDEVDGLFYIMVSEIKNNLNFFHDLAEDVAITQKPALNELFTINEDKLKKHKDAITRDVAVYLQSLTKTDFICNSVGIDDADTPHIKALIDEAEEILYMIAQERV